MPTLYCHWCNGTCNWEIALRGMARNGFAPRAILDIGACRGDWTNICKTVFPDARVLMVEPLEEQQDLLTYLTLRQEGVDYRRALLAAEAGREVEFYEQESLSSVFPFAEKDWTPSCRMQTETLDRLVSRTAFARPELVKIHVQGSELGVLQGAERTLAHSEVVFILVSLMELYLGGPLFHDIIEFMTPRGFRVYDVVHKYPREIDGAVAQLDVVFVRTTSRLLARKGW